MAMGRGELELIEWLETAMPAGLRRCATQGKHAGHLADDMACLNLQDGTRILLSCDLILDGTHFDSAAHDEALIARKALCACLSDCAAMAVQPLAAVVSLALPRGRVFETGKRLMTHLIRLAAEYDCPVVGGDTASWPGPLAIDVALIAQPWPGYSPVARGGGEPGDVLYVTGKLGGSLLGGHLTFEPRIREARDLLATFGHDLHALIDISDGLALDLHRLCRASRCGARLSEDLLTAIVSDDAHRAQELDGRSALEHALSDGEDYELLVAIAAASEHLVDAAPVDLYPVGQLTGTGVQIVSASGPPRDLEPKGYLH